MAIFDPDAELTHDLDFCLMRSSFVTMFRNPEILAGTLKWLTARRYDVAELDASACHDLASLLDGIAEALDFPSYFGRNINALNDCLADVATLGYGWSSGATGLVLVLRHYDRFAACDAVGAHAVLNSYADRARYAALFGNRMLCLVQTDDPRLNFPRIGASSAVWNGDEWLDSARESRP